MKVFQSLRGYFEVIGFFHPGDFTSKQLLNWKVVVGFIFELIVAVTTTIYIVTGAKTSREFAYAFYWTSVLWVGLANYIINVIIAPKISRMFYKFEDSMESRKLIIFGSKKKSLRFSLIPKGRLS